MKQFLAAIMALIFYASGLLKRYPDLPLPFASLGSTAREAGMLFHFPGTQPFAWIDQSVAGIYRKGGSAMEESTKVIRNIA